MRPLMAKSSSTRLTCSSQEIIWQQEEASVAPRRRAPPSTRGKKSRPAWSSYTACRPGSWADRTNWASCKRRQKQSKKLSSRHSTPSRSRSKRISTNPAP
eukprot:65784-Prymnesium_polylepis.1